MTFVADVQSNQECRDLFDDVGVFELPAIDGSQSRNLAGQFTHELSGVGIIAADDHIALDRIIAVHDIGGAILKRCDHGYTFGDQFGALLSGRALPHTERPTGAAANA